MPPAARIGDTTVGPPPHATAVILPPAATTVVAGVRPRARITDRLQCSCTLPDFIVTGSLGVQVHGLPAARVGSKTMHGGTVVTGALDIDVGGTWVGATFGNFTETKAAFDAMAAGRHPPATATYPNGAPIPSNTPTQSYNNCGIESSRQILHAATGSNISQEALLNQAMAHGWATKDPHSLYNSGGSWATGRAPLLTANGVPSHVETADMAHLTQAVAEGKGVSADIWAAKVWPPAVVANMHTAIGSNALPHAIVVTGMDYDAAGQLKTVFINDTGLGTVNQGVPAAQFAGALMGPGSGSTHLVTDHRVWK